MKKIVALVAVLFSVVVPVQAQADSKSLVIIDSYFDSRATGATIVCAPTLNCSTTAKPSTSIEDNTNHGDAMVEVAKRQGATNIIALRSAATPTSNVNAGNFIEALTWVNNNSSTVGAVSFSRFFNSVKMSTSLTECSPASENTAPYGGASGADKKIRDLITALNTKGIKVFAAVGNGKKSIDYPACILNTASVTSPNPNDIKTVDVDFNISLITLPGIGSNFLGTIDWKNPKMINPFVIPQATSSATAAVAAKWVVTGGFIDKVVSVQS